MSALLCSWLIDMGYVGDGTGEHTFPGQLAAQGCKEPAAAQVTLARADRERP